MCFRVPKLAVGQVLAVALAWRDHRRVLDATTRLATEFPWRMARSLILPLMDEVRDNAAGIPITRV
jgi:hypothetical protein